MSKLFNTSEEEKGRIRRLHLTEHEDVNNIENQIEAQLKSMTGEYASVSNRGESMRAKWTYLKWEFDDEVWETVLNFLRDEGYEILDGTRNYYERNWEPEEPAESVPTIYFR
tara:strand:- start:560 stop:895 length:336 start_codon:yes stop_codon:yes gene_type:complete